MMTAAHLAALWDDAASGCGVLPWLRDRPEPRPAVYPAEASPLAAGLLAGADASLNALTRALVAAGRMKRRVIGSPDANLYANLNPPADLQRHAAHSESSDD